MEYLMGIDIGTSGVKAIIIDNAGRVILSKIESYDINIVKKGWMEQDPEQWWHGTTKVVREIVRESGINKDEIKAIGFSGQMHSSVFLDENNKVLRPAILWNDTRTFTQCKEIYTRVGGLEQLLNYVSNPALEGFTAPKILWLKENEKVNYENLQYILLPKDYIRYKFTGDISMEMSDAAGTLLYDVKNKRWNKELIHKLDLKENIFPKVVKSTDIVGSIKKEIARELGLSEKTLIIAGGADNACAAIGSGIVENSKAALSIGTSGTIIAYTDKNNVETKGNLHFFNHACDNSWYLMTVMLSAGMCLKWFRNNILKTDKTYEELTNMASKVLPGSNGVIFLPYLFGERSPHPDPNAKSMFYGLSSNTTPEDLIRSVLEGVALGFKDCLASIEKSIDIKEIRLTGGGANSQLWTSIIADVLDREISLINVEEGPAFGAAIIAGVGSGVFEDFKPILDKAVKVKKIVKPNKENVKLYQKYYKIYTLLYDNLKECNRLLS
ncbi:xylulokinase [Irregularibacter muris]|uniref:Xylulose kinase n=1 Tax=Irregularibacter muris TaxID=1796619 RepID=A0AAE3KZZ0_9FIRM|nr:xylulokinase [Irregularibacter muris]MCR1899416.1 xylulokinase [Irregularibacter muris]